MYFYCWYFPKPWPLYPNALTHLVELFELLSYFWISVDIEGVWPRKQKGFGCGFGEALSCNCSTLVSLSIKWVQSVLQVIENCTDSGVVCSNPPIAFHLRGHKLVIYSHLDPVLCLWWFCFTPIGFYISGSAGHWVRRCIWRHAFGFMLIGK